LRKKDANDDYNEKKREREKICIIGFISRRTSAPSFIRKYLLFLQIKDFATFPDLPTNAEHE